MAKIYRKLIAAFAAITVALACITSIGHANVKDLVIDGEQIPLELVTAYGEALIHHQYNCLPLPYEAVRDRFVQSYITANYFKQAQLEIDQQNFQTEIAPYQKKIERLEKLILKHAGDSRIKAIYQQQLQRNKKAIETIRQALEKKTNRFSRTRIDKNSRLGKMTNISEEQKLELQSMINLERQSRRRTQDSISDKAVLARYNKLVRDKDSSLVDVYVFKQRRTIMGFADTERVENVKALMIDNATGMEIGRAGGIITAWSMMDESRWSAYNAKIFEDVDPGKLLTGEFIGPVKFGLDSHPEGAAYSLIYINDKKHYPVIGFEQDTVHRFSAEKFARDAELKVRQANEYEKLRSQIKVVEDGELVIDAQHDLTCKFK